MAKWTWVFHEHDTPGDLAFFRFFAHARRAVRNEQFRAFERFSAMSAGNEADQEYTSQSLESLFFINKVIGLIAMVKAIIIDLHKRDLICTQQKDVLRSLTRLSKPNRSIKDLPETVEQQRNAWAGMVEIANKTYESLRDHRSHTTTSNCLRNANVQSSRGGFSTTWLIVYIVHHSNDHAPFNVCSSYSL